jgi:AcrR family transcriptional regulator
MDELAAEAGLTKPILYAAFGDKAGLAAALAEHYLTDLLPKVLAAFDGSREPKEMVRTAIAEFIAFVEADPDVYRFLVRGVGGAERSFIEQRLVASFGLRIGDVLNAALVATGGDPRPAELWSFAILGTVLSGAEWWITRQTMSREEIVDHLTALVWGGLASGGIDRFDARAAFTTQEN